MPSPITSVPASTKVLVVGGGPGGSYCASVLAREGIPVVLLESSKFPRYHIGESMLPSLRSFLRYIDCEKKVEEYGFVPKVGAAVKFTQFKQEGYTDFTAPGLDGNAWNVLRSEFDELLLRHAEESGCQVFENHKVLSIEFQDGTPASRPVQATYQLPDKSTGTIAFDYLVDASGRNGIMSTKYLKNRKMNASLKNIATWGYWTGGKAYGEGTSRHNAPWFEALTDQSGWAWYIPLQGDVASVGIVMDENVHVARKKEAGPSGTLKSNYLSQIPLAPGLSSDFLSSATLLEDDAHNIRSASDYSYSASKYAGEGYRLVGDASAFIDPFFSSGVHLALTGALSAAATIAASIRGDCSELEASSVHDTKVAVSYTRFLLVVMGAYKQIRAQSQPVLSDVDENNFDKAFDIIRPVIQGTVDVHKKLDTNELSRTIDFVTHVLATPSDPEMTKRVQERLPSHLLDPNSAILLDTEVDALVDEDDEEAKHVLKKINARKPVSSMYDGPAGLASREINGMGLRLERGKLGLERLM